MELLGAHFFFTQPTWTPQELDKMRQNSVMRTRIDHPSRPWAYIFVTALFFLHFGKK